MVKPLAVNGRHAPPEGVEEAEELPPPQLRGPVRPLQPLQVVGKADVAQPATRDRAIRVQGLCAMSSVPNKGAGCEGGGAGSQI